MNLLHLIKKYLSRLGYEAHVLFSKNALVCNTGWGVFYVTDYEQTARLECRLAHDVKRNKIALWNVIHHNNAFFPFGQYYISPEQSVCFGLLLPKKINLQHWLERIVFELLSAGSGYCRVIQNDFSPFPFHESDLAREGADPRPDVLIPSERIFPISRESAAPMLERMLDTTVGLSEVVKINDFEYAITAGDHIVTLSIEHTPALRRSPYYPEWFIGVRTEVGVLHQTDNRLWVKMNRLNFNSFMLSYAIRYSNRRPLVSINTELIADFIQHPTILNAIFHTHNQEADFLLGELKGYGIQNIVNYKLGL